MKFGCRGIYGVLGMGGAWRGVWYNGGEKGGHPHMEQYLPMKLCMPPTGIVGW